MFPLKLWVEKDSDRNLTQLIKYDNSLIFKKYFLIINLKANVYLYVNN